MPAVWGGGRACHDCLHIIALHLVFALGLRIFVQTVMQTVFHGPKLPNYSNPRGHCILFSVVFTPSPPSHGNHSFDPFGSCPLVCIPHVLSYSLNFCSLWFLFPYVLWSPVHSGPLACIPRRFFFPYVCLSLILCVPMLFLFPYITASLCIV